MNINSAISKNIKQIREQKKLTLDAAAAVTSVSRSMLAQIERGDANPSVAVLWKIANGYKVSFSALLEHSLDSVTVLPLQNAQVLQEDDGYTAYAGFPFDARHPFENYRMTLDAHGAFHSEPHLPKTEEYLTVFQGTVSVLVNGSTFVLNEGDCMRFLADVEHTYTNLGETLAQMSILLYYAN